jgi:hypothetical protein
LDRLNRDHAIVFFLLFGDVCVCVHRHFSEVF